MVDSFLQYVWMLDPNGSFRNILIWTAVALSLIYMLSGLHRSARTSARFDTRQLLAVLAAGALLLAVVLIVKLGVIPLFSAELMRSFVLACFYIVIGARLGRE